MDFDEMKKWEIQEKSLKARRFKYLNALARKGQILFVGSSLMEQFPVHEILYADHSDAVIYNRGIGGYTIPEITLRDLQVEGLIALYLTQVFVKDLTRAREVRALCKDDLLDGSVREYLLKLVVDLNSEDHDAGP